VRAEGIVAGLERLNILFLAKLFQIRPALAAAAEYKGRVLSDEERRALVEVINQLVEEDPDLQGIIPVSPLNDDILKASRTGVLIARLLQKARPNCVGMMNVREE
jgi:hypothetical protein